MISEIRVCPLKRLYQLCTEGELPGVAAVISTSGDAPDARRLGGIPYVYALYQDLDFDGPGAFSDSDAARFADFVRKLDQKIATLYCVCDAAMSRSPAVAAAASRYFGIDAMDSIWRDPHYKPNMWVFEKLSTALGVPASDGELDQYIFESDHAFQNAIWQQENP